MDRTDFDLDDLANRQDIDIPEDIIPNDPGPAITGNTPVLGSLRRSQGLPVARDEIAEEFDI